MHRAAEVQRYAQVRPRPRDGIAALGRWPHTLITLPAPLVRSNTAGGGGHERASAISENPRIPSMTSVNRRNTPRMAQRPREPAADITGGLAIDGSLVKSIRQTTHAFRRPASMILDVSELYHDPFDPSETDARNHVPIWRRMRRRAAPAQSSAMPSGPVLISRTSSTRASTIAYFRPQLRINLSRSAR